MTFPYTRIANGDSRKNDAAIWNDVFDEFAVILGDVSASPINGSTVRAKLDSLKSRVDTIVAAGGTSNTEIVDMRSAGKVAAAATTSGERLAWAAGGTYNVMAYGALGDGSGDTVAEWLTGGDYDRGYANLAAIQVDYPHVTATTETIDWAAIRAAIDAANADGGGVVLVPPGTYTCNAILRPKSNVTLQGAGIGRTVIERASGYTSYLWLTTTAVTDFAVKDLTFDGTTNASGAELINFRMCYNLTFERVRFDTSLYYGVILDGCHNASGTYQNRIIDCEFENIAATSSTGGGIILTIDQASGSVGTGNTLIRGCKFANLTGLGVCGIRISQPKAASTGGSNIIISDCVFDSTVYDTAIGVFAADVDGLKIANCESQSGLANFFLLAKTVFGLKNVQVSNCRTTSSTDQGLALIGVDGFTVSGCVFKGCGYEGLDLLNARRGTVTGNTIVDNCTTSTTARLAGIRMSFYGDFTEANFNKDIVISGNTITDTRAYASKTQEIGVDIRTRAENIFIVNNYLRGNKTTSIADTSDTVSGNNLTCFYAGNDADDRPAQSSGNNILLNGDFSAWPSGTSVAPHGWETTNYAGGATGSIAQESSVKKFGAYSVKLTQTNTTSQFYFRPSAALALDAGEDYTFSAWVYVPSTNTPSAASIGIDNLGPHTFVTAASANVALTDTWQQLKFRFNTGSDGSGRVWIAIDSAANNDYILIDGAKLEKGSMPSEDSRTIALLGTANTFTENQAILTTTPTITMTPASLSSSTRIETGIEGTSGSYMKFATKTDGGATADRLLIKNNGNALFGTTTDAARVTSSAAIAVADGMTAPSATVGFAKIYVDTADGDLKVIFGDGTVKTIVTDT